MRLLVVGLWNDLFTFDNRFWRSLLLLLFKPGALTSQFIDGRRVRYIPPARMYLFVSIIFFFLMSVVVEGKLRSKDEEPTADQATSAAMADSIRAAVFDSLRVALADIPEIDKHLDGVDALGSGIRLAAKEDDGRTNGRIFGEEFNLDKKSLVGAVIKLLPKGMFLLLPLFAALLALIYRRSKRKYVEHIIFSLHFHAFVFILLSVAMITTWPFAWVIAFGLFYVYLYLAMKRVYGQGWGKTLVKHFLLTNAYHILFSIFITIVLAGGVYLAVLAEKYPKWMGWSI